MKIDPKIQKVKDEVRQLFTQYLETNKQRKTP